MSAFGLSASFNEPTSDDDTSAPPMPQNPVAPLLHRQKKPFGPKIKNPGALAAAISRAKKGYQSKRKFG